jgi:hypothetical protein
MALIYASDQTEYNNAPVSYIQTIADVFVIFILGLFLLILFKSYVGNGSNMMLFMILISVYFVCMNIYVMIYLNMVKNTTLTNGVHHRLLNFFSIYNVFLGIFMLSIGIIYN